MLREEYELEVASFKEALAAAHIEAAVSATTDAAASLSEQHANNAALQIEADRLGTELLAAAREAHVLTANVDAEKAARLVVEEQLCAVLAQHAEETANAQRFPAAPPLPKQLDVRSWRRPVTQRPAKALEQLPARSIVDVQLKKLTTEHGLPALMPWLDSDFYDSDTVAVFDFDLTLKAPPRVVRDHQRTRSVLRQLRTRGIPVLVLTATKPSVSNWQSIWQEVTDLHLDDLIGQGHNQDKPPEGHSTYASETGKFTSPCWQAMATPETKMVCGSGVILSGYEKPTCLHKYLQLYNMRPKHIVFVDDFVMNCFAMGMHFAAECSRSWELERVTSVWWDPTGVPNFSPNPLGSDNSYSSEETVVKVRDLFEGDGRLPQSLFAPPSVALQVVLQEEENKINPNRILFVECLRQSELRP